MCGYNVSHLTMLWRRTSSTLQFQSICLPWSGEFQNHSGAQRKGPEKFMWTDMKNGGMQNSRLSRERACQIFMANHSEVQWMAYKEHAELCTLYRSASVECSWSVWQGFFFPFNGISIRVTTTWWQVQLELTVLMAEGLSDCSRWRGYCFADWL